MPSCAGGRVGHPSGAMEWCCTTQCSEALGGLSCFDSGRRRICASVIAFEPRGWRQRHFRATRCHAHPALLAGCCAHASRRRWGGWRGRKGSLRHSGPPPALPTPRASPMPSPERGEGRVPPVLQAHARIVDSCTLRIESTVAARRRGRAKRGVGRVGGGCRKVRP